MLHACVGGWAGGRVYVCLHVSQAGFVVPAVSNSLNVIPEVHGLLQVWSSMVLKGYHNLPCCQANNNKSASMLRAYQL